MTARSRGRRARLDAVRVTNTAVTVGSWFRLRIELGKPSRVESVWIYIYMNEEATARMAGMDMRREEGEMKGIEVPEMKDTRTMSPSSDTCDPFYSTSAASSPARSFQAEDSLGTKDPATGMILIEYDYLPSSSGHRPPPFAREPSGSEFVVRRIVLMGIFSHSRRTDENEIRARASYPI